MWSRVPQQCVSKHLLAFDSSPRISWTYCLPKLLSQIEHWKGFSLVCERRCRARCSCFENALGQKGHWRCLVPTPLMIYEPSNSGCWNCPSTLGCGEAEWEEASFGLGSAYSILSSSQGHVHPRLVENSAKKRLRARQICPKAVGIMKVDMGERGCDVQGLENWVPARAG